MKKEFTEKQIEQMRIQIMPESYNHDKATDIAVNTKNPFLKEYMLIKLNNFSLIMADRETIDLREAKTRELIVYAYAFNQLTAKRSWLQRMKSIINKQLSR